MEHPYNVGALARIACHWCYNDVEATKEVMRYCQGTMTLSSEARNCAKLIITSVLDVSDSLQTARLNLAMSACQSGYKTGIIGLLQMSLKEATASMFRTLELLQHCCKIPFGFAIAVEHRQLLDWLDGFCVGKLRNEMQKKPQVFERLCLDGDIDVLKTPEGREFADTDSVNCFMIVRSLVRQMDELSPKQIELYHTQLVEQRNGLLETAIAAIRAGKPYIDQLEWTKNARIVKSGRSSAPENLRHRGGGHVEVVAVTPIHSMDDYDVKSVKENDNDITATPSEEEINGMIAQACEVLGSVNETQFRSLLKKYNYNLDQAIGATFS